jgi:hypothetical protein
MVAVTTIGALITVGLELRTSRSAGVRSIAAGAASTALLLVWSAYWGLAPLG